MDMNLHGSFGDESNCAICRFVSPCASNAYTSLAGRETRLKIKRIIDQDDLPQSLDHHLSPAFVERAETLRRRGMLAEDG